ncbi:MAG: MmcQ/YjbR family DNA-binding protein [Rhodoglobus sp.]
MTAAEFSPHDALDACAAFPAVTLEYPFGPETAVFKVVEKVFAVMPIDVDRPRLTLKSDPEDAVALVAEFSEITPGYHMNKKHWISIELPATGVPVTELIRASYDLVIDGLPRAKRPRP